MPSAKEIKSRIASIKDTQKITNAMYLISSTKLRKAKNELNRTRPYFDALKGEIKRIFRTVPDVDSRYFYPPAGAPKLEGEYACLVITADKGMAGAYNHNVLKIAREMLHEHPETELFVVGEYGRQHFAQAGIPIEKSFLYPAQNPTLHRAREICDILLERYDNGEFQKLFIVYTDMKNSLSAEATSTRLLPFHRGDFASVAAPGSVHFEFTPGVEAVLDNVIRRVSCTARWWTASARNRTPAWPLCPPPGKMPTRCLRRSRCSITACVRRRLRRRLPRYPPAQRHRKERRCSHAELWQNRAGVRPCGGL